MVILKIVLALIPTLEMLVYFPCCLIHCFKDKTGDCLLTVMQSHQCFENLTWCLSTLRKENIDNNVLGRYLVDRKIVGAGVKWLVSRFGRNICQRVVHVA